MIIDNFNINPSLFMYYNGIKLNIGGINAKIRDKKNI